jgi:hypothetical protein
MFLLAVNNPRIPVHDFSENEIEKMVTTQKLDELLEGISDDAQSITNFKRTFLYNFFNNNKYIFERCHESGGLSNFVRNIETVEFCFCFLPYIKEIESVMDRMFYNGSILIEYVLNAKKMVKSTNYWLFLLDKTATILHKYDLVFQTIIMQDAENNYSHANLLVIDNENKQIEIYEPHGYHGLTNHVNKTLKEKIFGEIIKNGYRFVSSNEVNEMFKPMTTLRNVFVQVEGEEIDGERQGGFCLYFCILLLIIRIYVYKNYTCNYWAFDPTKPRDYGTIYTKKPPNYKNLVIYNDYPIKVIEYLQKKINLLFSSDNHPYQSPNLAYDLRRSVSYTSPSPYKLTSIFRALFWRTPREEPPSTQRQVQTLSLRDFVSNLMTCLAFDLMGLVLGVCERLNQLYLKRTLPLDLAVKVFMLTDNVSKFITSEKVYTEGTYTLHGDGNVDYYNKKVIKVVSINRINFENLLGRGYGDNYFDNPTDVLLLEDGRRPLNFSHQNFIPKESYQAGRSRAKTSLRQPEGEAVSSKRIRL